MLNFNVSLGHVALIALANFLLSWAWYSPLLFMKPWAAALGWDPNRKPSDMSEEEKKRMPFLFLGGALSSFLRAFALAVLVASLNCQDFASGAGAGILAWAGFALTYSLDTLWEGRKNRVLLINNGLLILSHAAFGGILAAWH